MDIGHITQHARKALGKSKVAYRQDLTRPPGVTRLKVNDLGAGDFTFVGAGADTNPAHEFTLKGLVLSVNRPAGAAGPMGYWAAAGMQGVSLPDVFLAVATFDRPTQVALDGGPAVGTFAPSLLLNTGDLRGATIQFMPDRVRLNLPNLIPMADRPRLAQAIVDRILDPTHPSTFSLVLTVRRTATETTGRALLCVGNDEVDGADFTRTDVTTATPILDVRAGPGTAGGGDYRVSVRLLDFQLWVPAS